MEYENLPLTTRNDAEYLNDKQLETWEVTRRGFAKWLLERGKKPKGFKGYSEYTARDTLYRTDQFARYVWEKTGFTLEFSHQQADDYMEAVLKDDDSGDEHAAGTLKALKRLMRYQQSNDDELPDWECPWEVSTTQEKKRSISDVFSESEIEKLYAASLTYNDIPAYNDLSPEDRSDWKAYIAQALQKPKAEVEPGDWSRIDNWKIPSLVKVGIDAAFRPVEVQRSSTEWLDLEEQRLIIPAEDASKSDSSWRVGLGDMATRALRNWLEQRDTMSKYDDTDAIWLTREGNPYSSSSLRYLVLNLCEQAGIDPANRSVSWYSIRHATGSYLSKEGTIEQAREQLRHQSMETTRKYSHSTSKERSELANKR